MALVTRCMRILAGPLVFPKKNSYAHLPVEDLFQEVEQLKEELDKTRRQAASQHDTLAAEFSQLRSGQLALEQSSDLAIQAVCFGCHKKREIPWGGVWNRSPQKGSLPGFSLKPSQCVPLKKTHTHMFARNGLGLLVSRSCFPKRAPRISTMMSYPKNKRMYQNNAKAASFTRGAWLEPLAPLGSDRDPRPRGGGRVAAPGLGLAGAAAARGRAAGDAAAPGRGARLAAAQRGAGGGRSWGWGLLRGGWGGEAVEVGGHWWVGQAKGREECHGSRRL